MTTIQGTRFDTITPETEGNFLYNGGSVFSTAVYVPKGADTSTWTEVTAEERAVIEADLAAKAEAERAERESKRKAAETAETEEAETE